MSTGRGSKETAPSEGDIIVHQTSVAGPAGPQKWAVLSVTALAFFFVTATTFTSLAVLLYVMSADLHWSQSEAGFSFSLLALACGVSSPLPATPPACPSSSSPCV